MAAWQQKRVKVMNKGAPQLNNTAPTYTSWGVEAPHMHRSRCTDTKPMQVASTSLMCCKMRQLDHATVLQIAAHVDEKQGKTCQKAFDWVIHFMASVKYQQARLWWSTVGLDLAVRPTISWSLSSLISWSTKFWTFLAEFHERNKRG